MITAGRWITVVGLSPGPGSILWFSLEFSSVSQSCGTFPNHAVLLPCGAVMCRLHTSCGSRNMRANQDRDKLVEPEFHCSWSWRAAPWPAWRCTMPCGHQQSHTWLPNVVLPPWISLSLLSLGWDHGNSLSTPSSYSDFEILYQLNPGLFGLPTIFCTGMFYHCFCISFFSRVVLLSRLIVLGLFCFEFPCGIVDIFL